MNTIENIVHYNRILSNRIENLLSNVSNEEQLKNELKVVLEWLRNSSDELEILDKETKELIKKFVQLP